MSVNIINHAQALYAGEQECFNGQYKLVKEKKDKFYTSRSSKADHEEFTALGSFDDIPEHTGTVTEDTPRMQYTKRIVNKAYSRKFAITNEMLLWDQTGKIADYVQSLVIAAKRTREGLAMRPFNNAFTSELTGDGLSLVNSAHTQMGGSITWDNRIAAGTPALSQSTIAAAYDQSLLLTDDRNNQINYPATALLYPNALHSAVMIAVNSPGDPTLANLKANIIGSNLNEGEEGEEDTRLRLFRCARFTSTTAWYMCNMELMKQHQLKWLEVVRPGITKAQEFNTIDRLAMVYFNCGYGAVDWRGIWGSAGA